MECPLYPGNIMMNSPAFQALIMRDEYKHQAIAMQSEKCYLMGQHWLFWKHRRGAEKPWEVREEFLKK